MSFHQRFWTSHMRPRAITLPSLDFAGYDGCNLARVAHQYEAARETSDLLKPVIGQLERLIDDLKVKRRRVLNPGPLRGVRDNYAWPYGKIISRADDCQVSQRG